MKPAAALAAVVFAATMLLPSCASRPAPAATPVSPPLAPQATATVPASAAVASPRTDGTATPERSSTPTSALPASLSPPLPPTSAAREAYRENVPREKTMPAKERVDYLDAALADYRRETLPNGATLAIKRQAGRRTAAARIVLARDAAGTAKDAGLEALALSAAAMGPSGSASGGVELAAFEAGGSIELKLEDYDDVALELVCPVEGLAGLLKLVARALASPAFSQGDFDRALRDARVAERRESGDPLLRAAAELRSGLYRGHPYALPPRGTAKSLAGVTREDVMRYWSNSFGAERLSVVVVADADPGELARRIGPSFGALPRRDDPAAKPEALPIRPWFRAFPLSATPGSAVIRGEFGAPEASSTDFADLTVALAMLDDLLLEGLRGDRGLAYGAWTRLSAAAAPSASLTVYKTGNPAAAKAAVDAAIADLAAGLCLDVRDASGRLGPVSRSLEAYKSRAITVSYSRGASSEGMAARIARDLAAGGDGTALFRMAGRIREVRSEDVVRVARQRLLEGPSGWVALGDPDLVLALPLSAFVPRR
ncbi:MAG: insulinase family protein [Rectinemataceae bacterium]